jgi:hypothetical protein
VQGELQHGTTTLVASGQGNGGIVGTDGSVIAVVAGPGLQNPFTLTRNGAESQGLAVAIAVQD